ncbi:MAG: two component transcriptional regulator, LytTR family [Bacteroidetes bacterium]|jgi:two-component system LytT family response regulator|nr:two component transcriptional regulator, LytTR family [Bacteroidota bacterium]
METKITAILIDDEENSREVLRDLLENFFPEVELLGEAGSVEEALKLVNEKKPQLVFLDIQMPRQSGFNLLTRFEEVPFEVIFVTSYDQYAINAIKFSALDYLLKPVEIKDLQAAIDKAKKNITLKTKSTLQIVNLLHTVDTDIKGRKIAVHVGDHVKLLAPSAILYIESDGRYSIITTKENERFTTSKYLKDFEEYLGNDTQLIRIHKSCMINASHIKTYSKGEPCFIEMLNGKVFEIARRKKAEILERMRR